MNLGFIVDQETGGRAYYEKRLSRPSWPGGDSGLTIGVGYDLGYNKRDQFATDWAGNLPSNAIHRLMKACGVKGDSARLLVHAYKDIAVPWDAAVAVFNRVTVPRFWRMTVAAFPGVDKLHDGAQTALLSLVFNRGSSLLGERRREMRDIRDAVARTDYTAIARALREMKRLWVGKGLDGLLKRRDAEARLVEQ